MGDFNRNLCRKGRTAHYWRIQVTRSLQAPCASLSISDLFFNFCVLFIFKYRCHSFSSSLTFYYVGKLIFHCIWRFALMILIHTVQNNLEQLIWISFHSLDLRRSFQGNMTLPAQRQISIKYLLLFSHVNS